jgi:hypothetical protein
VHFEAEHHFDGPLHAVVAVLCDQDFYLALDLPDVHRPDLLGHDVHDGRTVLRLRYVFAGNLDPMAQRLVGADHLAWIQELGIDPAAATGTLHFEAEREPQRLHGDATFTLDTTGSATIRHLHGDLVVAVPAIGRSIERRLVPGILSRLDVEADGVEAQLRHGA